MNIVDFVDEVPCRLDGIHELPHQVGRIVLQAHVRRIVKGTEQRLESNWTCGDVRAVRPWFPEDSHMIGFTGSKIFFVVDTYDFVYLVLKRLGSILSRSRSDVGDA